MKCVYAIEYGKKKGRYQPGYTGLFKEGELQEDHGVFRTMTFGV
ncbi:hypothetical protein [Sulfurovum riftiae]|nr:hypothetical protein [Sulfurovum riftiae]